MADPSQIDGSDPERTAPPQARGAPGRAGGPPGTALPQTSTSTPLPVKRPLLASEALREDLAPLEPMRRDARRFCLALGAIFALLGGLAATGVLRGGLEAAAPALGVAAIALVATLGGVSYRQRAIAMVALGALTLALGLRGAGPVQGIGLAGSGWAALRLMAATALPALLIFRARYRAYPRARHLLVAGMALAIPFAAYALSRLFASPFGLDHAGAIVALASLALSLFGFMGAHTTGAGSYTAIGIVVGLSTDLVLNRLALPGQEPLREVLASGLAFGVSAATTSIGLFQVLAWRFGPEARQIDLHAAPPAPASRAPSAPDWSTRE